MKELFKQNQSRVRSMSMIHEQLYQPDDLARIDFQSHINRLIKSLLQTYPTVLHLEWDVDVDEIKLNIETSIPCAYPQ